MDKIREGGEAGEKLISFLEAHKKNIPIEEGSSGNKFRLKGQNMKIIFNPNNTKGGLNVYGNRTSKPFIGLSHELGHAYDYLDDLQMDQGKWFKIGNRWIRNYEKTALHWENRIRSENNLPLREYYGIEYGKGKGRVLVPGTSISPFFREKLSMPSPPTSPSLRQK